MSDFDGVRILARMCWFSLTLNLGRQLFERNKDLATTDDTLADEGGESVDISKYNREEAAEEDEEEGLRFSDSD